MRKSLAAAITLVLGVGIAVAGVGTANAAGSDGPTPYTVDAAGVTLPSPDTFADGGHVNIKYKQAGQDKDAGIHFESLNKQPSGQWIGKSVLPWSAFGLSGDYCITWVQVSNYNEHFGEGGQAPFCVTTAVAPPVTTPPATDPPASTAPPVTEPSCIANDTVTFTYTYAKDHGTVTASKAGTATGTLCTPLAIRATTWTYDLPASGKPSYPQTLSGFNDFTLSTLGTVTYTAPTVDVCRQYDIYASFAGFDALKLPAKLVAPNNPYEPKFLHATLNGSVLTYSASNSDGCQPAPTEVTPEPVTFVDTCGVAGDAITTPSDVKGYTYTTDDKRDANGVGTVTVTAHAIDGYVFPAGATTSWSHDFTDEPCPIVVKVPGDPSTTDQVCDLDNGGSIQGTITVTGATGLSYVIHKNDAPSAPDVTVADGTTRVAPGSYTVTAIALPGFVIQTPESWDYVIADDASECQIPTLPAYDASVQVVNPVCNTDGSTSTGFLVVDSSDPLAYYVGTARLAAGKTAMAPGTYTVTAVAPAGEGVSGTNPFTVTITAADTDCGELRTLAMTGVFGVPI